MIEPEDVWAQKDARPKRLRRFWLVDCCLRFSPPRLEIFNFLTAQTSAHRMAGWYKPLFPKSKKNLHGGIAVKVCNVLEEWRFAGRTSYIFSGAAPVCSARRGGMDWPTLWKAILIRVITGFSNCQLRDRPIPLRALNTLGRSSGLHGVERVGVVVTQIVSDFFLRNLTLVHIEPITQMRIIGKRLHITLVRQFYREWQRHVVQRVR